MSIVPEAPPPTTESEAESLDVWGFRDTHFDISENGHVIIRGRLFVEARGCHSADNYTGNSNDKTIQRHIDLRCEGESASPRWARGDVPARTRGVTGGELRSNAYGAGR